MAKSKRTPKPPRGPLPPPPRKHAPSPSERTSQPVRGPLQYSESPGALRTKWNASVTPTRRGAAEQVTSRGERLPTQASSTAQARAFGQQGAIMGGVPTQAKAMMTPTQITAMREMMPVPSSEEKTRKRPISSLRPMKRGGAVKGRGRRK